MDHRALGGRVLGHRILGLAAWVLALVGVVVVLRISGRGSLRLPAMGDASAWRRWPSQVDTTVVAFAVLRVLALGAAWYCLLVTVVGVAARLVRAASLVALVDRVTLPPLRRMLSAALSAGLATGLAGVGVAAAAPPTTLSSTPPVTVTMHRLSPAAASTSTPTTTAAVAPTTTTTTVQVPPPPATPASGPAPESSSPATPSSQSPSPASAANQWTVRPGDCFWSIASDVLARALGRQPADAEIAPYWRRLVEANRPALADASNPDLVFPGQVFTLPAP